MRFSLRRWKERRCRGDGAASRPARAHGCGEAGPVEDLAVRRFRNVVRGDGGPDAGTLVRPLVVEDGRRVPRAANAGWPDIEVTHAAE